MAWTMPPRKPRQRTWGSTPSLVLRHVSLFFCTIEARSEYRPGRTCVCLWNTGRVGIQVEGRHTLICGLAGVAGAVSIHLATVSGHTNVTSLRAASEISARSTRDLRETGAQKHLAGTLPSAGRCARCRRRHLLFCSSILKRGHRTRSARAMRRTQVKCACPVFPKLARGSQSKCVGVAHVCIVDHSRDPLRTSIYGSGVLLAGQEADM